MALISSYEITVYGQALEDRGLAEFGAIDGLGLTTDGLIWTCPNIWVSSEIVNLSTTWASSEIPGLSTSWSSSEIPDLVTTWVPATNEPNEC